MKYNVKQKTQQNPSKLIERKLFKKSKKFVPFIRAAFVYVRTNKQYGIVTTFVEPKLLTNKST